MLNISEVSNLRLGDLKNEHLSFSECPPLVRIKMELQWLSCMYSDRDLVTYVVKFSEINIEAVTIKCMYICNCAGKSLRCNM